MAAKSSGKWKALENYIAVIQDTLNLSQWDISVVKEASDVDAWATCEAHSQADTATIRVSHDFWDLKPDKQREVAIHEVLHLVTCRHDQVIENLEEPLGKVAWSVFEKQHDDASERVVDHMARVLSRWIPLPAFPEG